MAEVEGAGGVSKTPLPSEKAKVVSNNLTLDGYIKNDGLRQALTTLNGLEKTVMAELGKLITDNSQGVTKKAFDLSRLQAYVRQDPKRIDELSQMFTVFQGLIDSVKTAKNKAVYDYGKQYANNESYDVENFYSNVTSVGKQAKADSIKEIEQTLSKYCDLYKLPQAKQNLPELMGYFSRDTNLSNNIQKIQEESKKAQQKTNAQVDKELGGAKKISAASTYVAGDDTFLRSEYANTKGGATQLGKSIGTLRNYIESLSKVMRESLKGTMLAQADWTKPLDARQMAMLPSTIQERLKEAQNNYAKYKGMLDGLANVANSIPEDSVFDYEYSKAMLGTYNSVLDGEEALKQMQDVVKDYELKSQAGQLKDVNQYLNIRV